MDPDLPLPTGLKPTLRQMMILVAWAALLSMMVRVARAMPPSGLGPEFDFMNITIGIGFWPMATLWLLVMVLDRRGPVRTWYASSCVAFGGFLGASGMLLIDPYSMARTGHPTPAFPVFVLCGLLSFFAGVMHLRTIWPRRCARCDHRAVIPTWRLIRWEPPDGPPMAHGWCALCGATHEREGLRAWTLATGKDDVNFRPGFFRALRTFRDHSRRRRGRKIG